MILKGDISTFHPANLLLFFADFEREGLLTVEHPDDLLTISLKGAEVINAHSKLSDDKLLNAVYLRKFVNKKQLLQIQQMKEETGLPAALIIEKLKIVALHDIHKEITNGIYEVLFQLFRMNQGPFHLTDVAVEKIAGVRPLECRRISLEMSRWVDEWQEMERSLSSLDRVVGLQPDRSAAQEQTQNANEKLILTLAKNHKSIRRIIATAPITSFMALKALHQSLAKNSLVFIENNIPLPAEPAVEPADLQFNAFRDCFRKMILAPDRQSQIAKIITFCRDHFDRTAVLASDDTIVRNCIVFTRQPNGTVHRRDLRQIEGEVRQDPIFENVLKTGHAYFGNVYRSAILHPLLNQHLSGDCALIRMKNKDGRGMTVYVTLDKPDCQIRLFQYLEILTWIINPPREEIGIINAYTEMTTGNESKPSANPRKRAADNDSETRLHQLVEAMEELPPIPHVVTQIMDLLADPEYAVSQLTDLLSNDQVLVAKLLKVSNSALYARGKAISNLKEALTRLGTRTVKSIVITASLKSFFKNDSAQISQWSRDLWNHSKKCALAAKRIAEMSTYKDPEEAFIGGILHDIGKLALFMKYPDAYAAILDNTLREVEPVLNSTQRLEKKALGFDHTDIGSLLMKKWGMPDALLNCVRYHHQVNDAKEYADLVRCVSFGNDFSHQYETLAAGHASLETLEKPGKPSETNPPVNAEPSGNDGQMERMEDADNQLQKELCDQIDVIVQNLSIPLQDGSVEALCANICKDFDQTDIFE